MAAALSALLGALSLSVAPAAAHADDVAQLAGLGPVVTTQVGTVATSIDPVLDDTNVAAGDQVRWLVPYEVSSPGTITLHATLPSTARFDPVSVSLGGPGSEISADGHSATYVVTHNDTGQASWRILGTVSGANGASVALTVEGGGRSSTAPAVTVLGQPTFNIRTATYTGMVAGGTNGSDSGTILTLPIGIVAPIDPESGLLGLEPLADSFTFRVDARSLPADAVLHSCEANVTTTFPGPSGGGNRNVPNSGDWECSYENGVLTVTVTGADTSATSYPSLNASGSALSASEAWVASHAFSFFIPAASLPTGASSFPVQIFDFDPLSISGQSNYGADFAPGQAPDAAFERDVNGATFAISNTSGGGGGFSNRLYWQTRDGQALPGWTNNSSQLAGPLYPGQPFRFDARIMNQSPANETRTNTTLCVTWDPTQISATGPPANLAATTSVEYGVISGGLSAQLGRCGKYGDGAAGWYSTLDSAEAVGTVAAVRAFVPDAVPASASTLRVMTIPMVRTLEPLANGAEIRVAVGDQSDGQTTAGTNLTPRATAASSQLANTISVPAANVDPGGTATVTVRPSVSNVYAPDLPSSTAGVTVQVTLPAAVSYVTGSASLQPTSVSRDARGVTALSFDLGSVSNGAPIAPITFDVQASASVVMPEPVTIRSVIDSEGNFEPAAERTATAGFAINALQQFGFTKSVSSRSIQPGDSLTYTVTAFNTLAGSIGPFTAVDVLPYDGDANGSTGVESFRVTGLTASDHVVMHYTTDDPAAVRAAARAEATASTVNWIAYTGGRLPAGVTAIKATDPSLTSGQIDSFDVTIGDIVASNHAVLANSITALAAEGGTAGAVHDAARVTTNFTSSSLSGTVYRDVDHSGGLTQGDTPYASQRVTLSGYAYGPSGVDEQGGGTNVAIADRVVTTDAEGRYTFPHLAAGTYTTTAAPDGASSNGDIVSNQVVAANSTVTGKNLGFYPSAEAPKAVDDAATVAYTTPTSVDALRNDTGAALELAAGSAPTTTGDVTAVYVGGKVRVTPGGHNWAAGETSYQATVRYTVTGVFGLTSAATITLTILKPPEAVGDTAMASAGRAVTIDVLANDSGTELEVTHVGASAHGDATIAPDGRVSFAPHLGFAGDATFSYTATDRVGQTATATVTVTVIAWPVASDDTAKTAVDSPVAIDVLANDIGIGLTVISVGSSAHGVAAIGNDGSVTFTPSAGFTGTASFTYTVADVVGATSQAEVIVTVSAKPVAHDDSAETAMDRPVTTAVLDNDSGSELTVKAVEAGADGTAAANADGTITFAPTAGFAGNTSYRYTVIDAFGQTATATVSVAVLAAPVAADDHADAAVDARTKIDVLHNDTGTGLEVTAVGSNADGTAAINADGTVTFTPRSGFTGGTAFTYTVTDRVNQTASATVTIRYLARPATHADIVDVTSEDDPIRAVGVSQLAGEGLRAPVFANDELDSNGSYTVRIDALPSGLRAVPHYAGGAEAGRPDYLALSASDDYLADVKSTTTVTFGYTLTDQTSQSSNLAVVTMVIVPAPVANGDPQRGALSGGVGAPVTAKVLGNDTTGPAGSGLDADHGVYTVEVTGAPAHGSADVAGAGIDQEIVYTPAAGYAGTDRLSYTLTDQFGQASVAEVRFAIVAAPVTRPDDGWTGGTKPVTVNVLANDSGSDLNVTGASVPAAHGTAAVERDGSVTFTPKGGFIGQATVTYTVTDSVGQTATGALVVTVTKLAVQVHLPDRHRGETQGATGTGFKPGETVTAVMHSDAPIAIGTAQASANGTVTFTWTVPEAAEHGEHVATLSGPLSGEASETFNVLKRPAVATDDAGQGAPGGPGVRTGGTMAPAGSSGTGTAQLMMLGGLAAVLATLGFVVIAARRRRVGDEGE